jgi:hypothetical protein
MQPVRIHTRGLLKLPIDARRGPSLASRSFHARFATPFLVTLFFVFLASCSSGQLVSPLDIAFIAAKESPGVSLSAMHAAHARILLIVYIFWQFFLALVVNALPLAHQHPVLRHRRDAVIEVLPDGNITVFNSDTQQVIPQGPATDGAGSDFSPSSVVWIVFSFVIGGPLCLAGIRGARLTTGCALGLAGAVCCT